MPQMPRDDEEERFDQRREDQVAVQGHRLRRVGDQVVRPRRRGPARRPGLAVLQGQPIVCVHLDVEGFVTISERSWRSFWTVRPVVE